MSVSGRNVQFAARRHLAASARRGRPRVPRATAKAESERVGDVRADERRRLFV